MPSTIKLQKFIGKLTLPFCVLALLLISGAITSLHAQLHDQQNLDFLDGYSSKNSLSAQELDQVRVAMLKVSNEARLNPNYRKQQKCKKALNLPSNLSKLVLDDRLNRMAQEQAVYQAQIKKVTHDNRNYADYGARVLKHITGVSVPEACGGGSKLSKYPIGWLKSETHYRPSWNLDDQVVTAVGYGAAKNPDNGMWYFTAVWANLDDASFSGQASNPNGTTSSQLMNSLLGVGTSSNIGKWQEDEQKWEDQGRMGGWTLKMLTFDSNGDMWCVGTADNVGKWNGTQQKWEDQGRMGGWTLKMLTFDSNGDMWCVGTADNVGKWNGTQQKWEDQGRMGGWTLKMLTFDSNGDMWCVGTAGNVGKWNGTQQKWEDQGRMGGWTLKMLTFDSNGDMWCVGTADNVGKWNGTQQKWEDQGRMGGWTLDWIAPPSKK